MINRGPRETYFFTLRGRLILLDEWYSETEITKVALDLARYFHASTIVIHASKKKKHPT
jgi:hypothetical protein